MLTNLRRHNGKALNCAGDYHGQRSNGSVPQRRDVSGHESRNHQFRHHGIVLDRPGARRIQPHRQLDPGIQDR